MIAAEHVTKYYGAHAAVDDLTFEIATGEAVGLLGLNGAGKTTTLKILSGLLLPTAGGVSVDGMDMARNPEAIRARIGFLPETPPLYEEMTVAGYLEFVARIKGVQGPVDSAVREALAATDLKDVRDDVIDTLSHGYRRRVGIAQAVVHRPAMILLDEPTSGLDPVQIVHMRQLIRNLRQRHTIIVSSHILSEIHAVCDRIFVLHQGRIAASGTEDELASRVRTATTVQVEVRGQRQALDAALRAFDGRIAHRLEGEQDGVSAARVELRDDQREALAQHLVDAGLGLRELHGVRLELENIFLELTGDAAGGGPVEQTTAAAEN
mgnify:CR=1 FL=1